VIRFNRNKTGHPLISKSITFGTNLSIILLHTAFIFVGFCKANAQLTIAMSSPAPDITFTSSPVSLSADGSDGVTTVNFFDLFNGNTILIGPGGASPFTENEYDYDWSVAAADNGTHQVFAVASDDSGNSVTSAPVAVIINISQTSPPGTVTITAPDDNSVYSNSDEIAIAAELSSNIKDTVSAVSFFDNSTDLLGVTYSAPYVLTPGWSISAADNGSHQLTAVASDNSGDSWTSSPITITIQIPIAPSITNQPQSVLAPVGSHVTFTAGATGTDLSFQWERNGVILNNGGEIAGATSNMLTLASITTNDAGIYNVVVSNSLGTVSSSAAQLTVILPGLPVIAEQPQSQVVSNCQTVIFTVTAVSTTPLTYQWMFGFSPLPNQTNASLTLANVAATNAGDYSVLVANAFGSTNSSVAVLSFFGIAPSIISQPQGLVLASGQSADFNVSASGTAPLEYQWQKNLVSLTDGGNITGSASNLLSLVPAGTNDTGKYRVVITNSFGSVTSQIAALTVIGPGSPVITQQPQSQTVTNGAAVIFSVTAVSTTPLSYQWFFNATALAGRNDSTLSLPFVTSANAGHYSALITNQYGALFSGAATLAVVSPPLIATQPTNIAIMIGGTASFSVAVSGNGPFTYQWQHNGTNLPANVVTTVAGNGVAGYYDSDGSSATRAFLNSPGSVAADGAGNVFIADTDNNRIRKVGTNGIITTVVGMGYPTDDGDGGQATSADTYLPGGLAMDASGNLFIKDFGNSFEDLWYIREVSNQGIINTIWYSGVEDMAVDASDNVLINDTYFISGISHPFIYRWDFNLGTNTTVAGNGTQGFSGDGGPATSAGLNNPEGLAVDALGNLFIADSGNYRVCKVNTSGIITTIAGNGIAGFSGDGAAGINASLTDPQSLAVDTSGNLFISDGSRIRRVGSDGIIVTVAGNGTFGYSGDGGAATNAEFAFGGAKCLAVDSLGDLFVADAYNNRVRKITPLGGPVLTLPNINEGEAGNYTVVVSGPYGNTTSTNAFLTVIWPPAIANQPYSLVVTQGQSATFSVAATGGPPLSYQWFLNGILQSDATNSSLTMANVGANTATNYVVVVTNVFGAVTNSVATLTIIYPASIVIPPANQFVTNGQTTSINVTASGTPPLNYQWFFNGTALANGSAFSGINSSNLMLLRVTTNSSGNYSVVVNNSFGSTSSVAVLVVLAPRALTVLHTFGSSGDGAYPEGGVILSSNILYGTTSGGGSVGYGTLFSLNLNSKGYVPLYSFYGAEDGGNPLDSLVSSGGRFYGTSFSDGVDQGGTLFSMIANPPNLTVLYPFTDGTAGSPVAGLVSSNTMLYGTTAYGGISNAGTIFSLNTRDAISTFSVLHTFTNGADGAYPEGQLLLVNGTLYGTAFGGGDQGNGTVFSVGTDGGFNVLHQFSNLPDGAGPLGGLALFDKTLYGTTSYGGGTNSYGTIFSIGTNGNGFKVLYTFTGGPDGASPWNGLMLSGNTLYGTTHGFTDGNNTNYGTVFAVNTNGGLTVLYNFSGGVDGASPEAGLVSSGSTLYGAAAAGGTNNSSGTLFCLTTLPSITSQPQSITVSSNGPASFAVVAAGTPPLIYQWRFGSKPLAGDTNATLAIIATNKTVGNYTVVVSDPYGSVTSVIATLTIIAGPPGITNQPQSLTADSGQPVSFNVTAYGTAPLSFQWFTNGVMLGGATNPILALPLVTANSATNYTVVIANAAGSVTSSPAILSVIGGQPFITVEPTNLTVPMWAPASFSVTAYGSAPLAYQWLTNGVPIGGATNSILLLPFVTTNSPADYLVIVSNTNGNVASSNAILTVVSPPAIITPPQPQTVTQGQSVQFSVLAVGSGIGYQWLLNGVALTNGAGLSGVGSSNFTISSVTPNNYGKYTVLVTNGGGVSSDSALLTVLAPRGQIHLHTFGTVWDGANPYGFLVKSGDTLYGTTAGHGTNYGTIFSVKTNGANYTVLYNFTNGTDGANPYSSLVLSGNTLYGVAVAGGSNNLGTVFAINTDGTSFQTVHTFTGQDGANPYGGLALTNGTLYGTSSSGGSSNAGTVFSLDTDGTDFTNFYSFSGGSDGANPQAGLALAGKNLYGTTANGGAYGNGALFYVTTNGSFFTNFYSFGQGGPFDGANPHAPLALSGQALYGTAMNGGVNGNGVLFSVGTDGTLFTNFYNFSQSGISDGANPYGGLVLSGSTVYGTAVNGGTNLFGIIFSVKTNGTAFTNLYNFTGGPDGANPYAGVVLSGNMLFGSSTYGGIATNGNGSVFSFSTGDRAFGTLYTFSDGVDGFTPQAAVVLAGGVLYGTTTYGGDYDSGDIFAVRTNGIGYKLLYTFTGGTNDGAYPSADLTVAGSVIYGTAVLGGTNGSGSVFAMSTNGTGFTNVYSFSGGADGAYPQAGLILSNGTLYGTVAAGGTLNNGAVFSVRTNGAAFTNLYSFTGGSDGGQPVADLILSGKSLYGTTSAGGAGYGTIFSLATNGASFSPIYAFSSGGADGYYPVAPLVLSSNILYGTTVYGGDDDDGTVFSVQTNGLDFTVLHSFTGSSDGANPQAGLVIFDNIFYGVTSSGGDNGAGTVFLLDTNGAGFAVLYTLNGDSDGADSKASLVISGGNLYGTTSSGSGDAGGAAFCISGAPVITTQPTNIEVALGDSAYFRVTAVGALPLHYHWQTNGVYLSGATNSTLTNSSVTASDLVFRHTVVVTNIYGNITSTPALLFLPPCNSCGAGGGGGGTPATNDPPWITTDPESLTVDSGQAALFAITAYGSPPLGYQWSLNGQALADQTNAVLNLPSATTNDAGNYSVLVYNDFGATNSGVALLTVVVPPGTIGPIRPWIISQSTNETVGSGRTAQFKVEASGSGLLSYQWFFNGVARPRATIATLSVPSVSTSDAGSYSVVVSSLYGSVTSSPVLLTVGVPPSISSQPQNLTVTNGQTATFSTTVVGDAPLSYQWVFDNTNLLTDDGSNIFGAASATLVISNTSAANQGTYAVMVTNTYGVAISSNVNLVMLVPPSITQQPLNQAVAVGDSATFNVTIDGTAPLSYQWLLNGTNLPGATAAQLALTQVTTDNAGNYAVVVANSAGSITSSDAVLSVVDVPPSILTQPQDLTVTNGQPATFGIMAVGDAPLTYQWVFNGTNLLTDDGSNIFGSASTTLFISNTSVTNQGIYTVVVTNAYGIVISLGAKLVVLVPPSITQQPINQAVAVGDSTTFTVTLDGTAPLSYQWFFNGTNLPGAIATPLTLSNVTMNDAGTYAVTVANSAGSTTSSNATLVVYPTAAAALGSVRFSNGEFQFSVTGVPGYSYTVQVSTNLYDWSSIFTNTAPLTFVDTNEELAPALFYRVVYPPQ
jgi:uncharacterized repeat protein (TIGR03803 family)